MQLQLTNSSYHLGSLTVRLEGCTSAHPVAWLDVQLNCLEPYDFEPLTVPPWESFPGPLTLVDAGLRRRCPTGAGACRVAVMGSVPTPPPQ
jgi:hypothetical protein